MSETFDVLTRYGDLILFVLVLCEQIGLPIPAVPALLGVGALVGAGRMNPVLAFGVVLVASLLPDLLWYELGRRRGGRVLSLLCQISLEPDSCVRRTENLFMQRGRKALVIAKFLPGLSTVAPPLAGIVGIARWQFLLLDAIGALAWAGTWMGLGYLFSDALDAMASHVDRLGSWLAIVVAGALASYVLVKFVNRERFLRSLRVARITPDELKRRLDAGDDRLLVVDTRSALDVTAAPYAIPGAIWITDEEIDRRHLEVPRDREIVLYCT